MRVEVLCVNSPAQCEAFVAVLCPAVAAAADAKQNTAARPEVSCERILLHTTRANLVPELGGWAKGQHAKFVSPDVEFVVDEIVLCVPIEL